jgi:PAS domain S-box-containing protein
MNVSSAIDYEAIFLNAPVGMCVSQHRIIRACNHAMTSMFGYSPQEVLGQSFLRLYPSADEFERTGERIAPIMSRTGTYSDERIMRRANGELFWCHVTGRALERTDPHAAAIWTFEDLSEKRTVSAELTAREREIAALLVEGKTSKNIGRELNLSPRTVEMYRARLMRKFGAATSSELVGRLLGGAL